jgi:thiol-disulfide isomerase/thioredoxin
MKTFISRRLFLTNAAVVLGSLLMGASALKITAADRPPLPLRNYEPTNDEFIAVSKAVVQLLQSGDTARFAAEMSPSIADWKSLLSTNLPVTSEDPLKGYENTTRYQREKVESSAKELLARAAALHVDFSKSDLKARIVAPNTMGSMRYPNLQGEQESIPWTKEVQVFLTENSGTNSGEFQIAVRSMVKYPGGWRSSEGVQWEAFPAGIADEKTTRELALLSKVAAYEGFSGQEDPALLKLGEVLVRFIRERDTTILEKEALINSDLVWAQMQNSGRSGPSRKELDENIGPRVRDLVESGRTVLKQMDDAGVDLKNADVRVEQASIKRAQAQGSSLDGLIGTQFKLTLGVKSDAKSKNGTPLSGRYVLAANSLNRFGDDWRVMDDLRWYEMPDGVVDDKTVAAMQFEDYVAENRALPPGTTAPEIEFTTLDGEKNMKLSDLRGKVVVLDFWATWCGPCQEPMAKLQPLRKEHTSWKDRVAIVPLSIDDSIDVVQKHVNKRGWTNTFNAWAGDGGWRSKPAKTFRVTGVPTTYIIDTQGKIVRAGHPAGMQIGEEVDALLRFESGK